MEISLHLDIEATHDILVDCDKISPKTQSASIDLWKSQCECGKGEYPTKKIALFPRSLVGLLAICYLAFMPRKEEERMLTGNLSDSEQCQASSILPTLP